jgi:hypothetical protein
VFAPGPIADMNEYLAARNQTPIHLAMVAIAGVTGILAGYLVAKIVGQYEMQHAAIAAVAQTLLLVRGYAGADPAAALPAWLEVALVAVTAPAMLLGAFVRARAAKLNASNEVGS